MKIVITGANGYIAQNIIKNFKTNKNITLLTHKNTKHIYLKKFDTLRFDLKKKKNPKIIL